MAVMRIEGDCTKDVTNTGPSRSAMMHHMNAELPKPIQRTLATLAARAHEAALHRALTGLSRDFDRWKRAEIDSLALADRIHEFHDGPNREIYLRYNGKTDPRVCSLLARELIPPEVMPYLASA